MYKRLQPVECINCVTQEFKYHVPQLCRSRGHHGTFTMSCYAHIKQALPQRCVTKRFTTSVLKDLHNHNEIPIDLLILFQGISVFPFAS